MELSCEERKRFIEYLRWNEARCMEEITAIEEGDKLLQEAAACDLIAEKLELWK